MSDERSRYSTATPGMPAPMYAVGDPVEARTPIPSAMRGTVIGRRAAGASLVWMYRVRWAGPDGLEATYPELQLRPATADDQGEYSVEVPLF